jgi:hypothetical protein
MKTAVLLSLLCVPLGTALPGGQDPVFIPGTFALFTTDELGNSYAISGDEVMLFDPRGRELARNSIKTLGRIHAIDAFYSLKPLLFSREQGMLAVLDNTLSVQATVDLSRGGYPQVTMACASVQNAYWLFDDREMALIRVDGQLRKLADTGRLDQLLGVAVRPTSMQEHDSRLYVNVPDEGILVFDLFGTYARTIPLKNAHHFEVRGNMVHVLGRDGYVVYDMRSFAIENIPLSVAGTALALRVERGRTYVLTDRGIAIADR